jgi:hypothetical protein
MAAYINLSEFKTLTGTALTAQQETQFVILAEYVSDLLRQLAINQGKDLDVMIEDGAVLPTALKGVVANGVSRYFHINTNTSDDSADYEAPTFTSYQIGFFIKNDELNLIGLKNQEVIKGD